MRAYMVQACGLLMDRWRLCAVVVEPIEGTHSDGLEIVDTLCSHLGVVRAGRAPCRGVQLVCGSQTSQVDLGN